MPHRERFARITGMDESHVAPSHMDHHSHHTAGHACPVGDGKVEKDVEKMYGHKIGR